jgi:hypothetical protein
MATSTLVRLVRLVRLAGLVPSSLALLVVAGATAHAQVIRESDLGSQQFEFFSNSIANTGDVDGDGVDDFIVGAPYYSTTTIGGAGHAIVYSGATGALVREHVGSRSQDFLGYSVASAGDVDGDGVPDYVVGAPGHTRNQTRDGLVVVYSGSTGALLWETTGTTQDEELGASVAGIGDVDGDGKCDVVVGSNHDEAFVCDAHGGTLFHLTHGASFGYSVAGCGDVDGDGVPDLLVGEPLANHKVPPLQDCGEVRAYSGATGLLLYAIHGTNASDQLGRTLARLGDLDGDGVGDFIAGSQFSDANGTNSGIVRVVSGASGATIREQTGTFPGDALGSSVGGLGDVDLDGVPDDAVGATGAGVGSTGRLRVCSGADGSTIYELTAGSANFDLGSAVAGGDWNGDGVGDLVAGDVLEIDASGAQVGGVAVVLMCPAWSASYGPGWPGRNGIPTLTAQEKPVVGAPLDVDLSNSLGAATSALLFVGVQPADIQIRNSGTLLVAPLLSVVVPVPASGLTLRGKMPNDPSLWFFDLYLQALELDPYASKGLSFTPGLQLHCGFDLP